MQENIPRLEVSVNDAHTSSALSSCSSVQFDFVGKFDGKDIDMKPQMPTAPENMKNALLSNFEYWADNQDSLNERFNAWIAKN